MRKKEKKLSNNSIRYVMDKKIYKYLYICIPIPGTSDQSFEKKIKLLHDHSRYCRYTFLCMQYVRGKQKKIVKAIELVKCIFCCYFIHRAAIPGDYLPENEEKIERNVVKSEKNWKIRLY